MTSSRGRSVLRADDSYDYTPSAILVGEVDGIRIVSSSTCDFLQKVPGTPT